MSASETLRAEENRRRFKWAYNRIFHKEKSMIGRDFYSVFNPECPNPTFNYVHLFPNLTKRYHAWFKNKNLLLKKYTEAKFGESSHISEAT